MRVDRRLNIQFARRGDNNLVLAVMVGMAVRQPKRYFSGFDDARLYRDRNFTRADDANGRYALAHRALRQ